MLLAVKAHIQIPHDVVINKTNYSFNPTCEVPDDWGTAALKNAKHIFMDGNLAIDESKYTVKDKFFGKSLEQIVNTFSPSKRRKLHDFIHDLDLEDETPKDLPKPVATDGLAELLKLEPEPVKAVDSSLDLMSRKKLLEYAASRNIPVPNDVVEKDDIRQFIKDYEKGQ